MKEIIINDIRYHVLENIREALNEEELEKKITDYFQDFDYIVGDWAYGRLRLKGFNNKQNVNFKQINDIDKVDGYIKEFCAYGCRYFIIAKINT